APYTFSISAGALPRGTALNSGTGTISGTPTNSGTASFTVQAQDSVGNTGTVSYNLSVQALLTSTVSLPVVNTSFDGTPFPGYVGKWTATTNLVNNGPTISGTSNLYFVVSSLFKYFGDPAKPDTLWSADGGAGVVGAR